MKRKTMWTMNCCVEIHKMYQVYFFVLVVVIIFFWCHFEGEYFVDMNDLNLTKKISVFIMIYSKKNYWKLNEKIIANIFFLLLFFFSLQVSTFFIIMKTEENIFKTSYDKLYYPLSSKNFIFVYVLKKYKNYMNKKNRFLINIIT